MSQFTFQHIYSYIPKKLLISWTSLNFVLPSYFPAYLLIFIRTSKKLHISWINLNSYIPERLQISWISLNFVLPSYFPAYLLVSKKLHISWINLNIVLPTYFPAYIFSCIIYFEINLNSKIVNRFLVLHWRTYYPSYMYLLILTHLEIIHKHYFKTTELVFSFVLGDTYQHIYSYNVFRNYRQMLWTTQSQCSYTAPVQTYLLTTTSTTKSSTVLNQ